MRQAFTLIELLVVITIIVVLLALLTPALDEALYQAKLARCAAQQDTVMNGAMAYAFEFKRFYPYKLAVHDGTFWRPGQIFAKNNQAGGAAARYDHRKMIRNYFRIDTLLDPLGGQVDLDQPTEQSSNAVISAYALWYGFKYTGYDGMLRVGDTMTWNGTEFNLLIGDTVNTARDFYSLVSHPDMEGRLGLKETQYESYTFTMWEGLIQNNAYVFGPIDMNYGLQDGSVRRVADIGFVPANTPLDPGDHPLRVLPFVAQFGGDTLLNDVTWTWPGR